MAPGVSPDSIQAAVPLPQMPAVVNLPPIPNKETLAPAQVTEAIPIATADDTIDTKMDNMIKVFDAWTSQMSKEIEPGYGGYHTARAHTIQADQPPPHTAMNSPPPNAPMGSNSQQHPQQ